MRGLRSSRILTLNPKLNADCFARLHSCSHATRP